MHGFDARQRGCSLLDHALEQLAARAARGREDDCTEAQQRIMHACGMVLCYVSVRTDLAAHRERERRREDRDAAQQMRL